MKICPLCKKDGGDDQTYWWPHEVEEEWTKICQTCWEKECSKSWWEVVNSINENLIKVELPKE